MVILVNDRRINRGGEWGEYKNINSNGCFYIKLDKSREYTKVRGDIYTTGGDIQTENDLCKTRGDYLNIKRDIKDEISRFKGNSDIPGDFTIIGDEDQRVGNIYKAKAKGSSMNNGGWDWGIPIIKIVDLIIIIIIIAIVDIIMIMIRII